MCSPLVCVYVVHLFIKLLVVSLRGNVYSSHKFETIHKSHQAHPGKFGVFYLSNLHVFGLDVKVFFLALNGSEFFHTGINLTCHHNNKKASGTSGVDALQ